MLTEKRYEVILKCLNEKNSITVTELKELLGISESTIRRDLTALDKAGKLVKVFGGAVAVDSGFTTVEPSVAQKSGVNKEEKSRIAQYAASLISPNEFVYLDAGTTTGRMIEYITEKSAVFVTNAVSHAQRDWRRIKRDNRSCGRKSGNLKYSETAFFKSLFWCKWNQLKGRVQHSGLQ